MRKDNKFKAEGRFLCNVRFRSDLPEVRELPRHAAAAAAAAGSCSRAPSQRRPKSTLPSLPLCRSRATRSF